jgi:acetyl-CoA C-acetyltransferase
MLAADLIRLGDSESVIAGGMESMSNAPYILPNMRNGARYGNASAEDTIIKDGLWDVYKNYLMGCAAELLAKEHKITREQQDEFATNSYKKAISAIESGLFKNEIIPIKAKMGKEEVIIEKDEEPFKANLAKIPTLKPAFEKDGTVTAANASSLNDGAALMIVCSLDYAKKNNLTPVAKIRSYATHSHQPEWFTTAPITAVEKAVSKASLKLSDIDLFEINEAFSCVAMACQSGLKLDSSKLNINGGAVALGHPIGASGARILVTLLHSLIRTKSKLGAVGICNGGGEATAMVIESVL